MSEDRSAGGLAQARIFTRSLLGALALATCAVTGFSAHRASASEGSLFSSDPTVRANPIERVPLVAIVEFETSEAVAAVLEIDDGQRRWEQAHPQTMALQHRIAVMGMRPARNHSIRVRLQGEHGVERSSPLSFTTPPLPASFPPLRTTVTQPARMEPGLTLFAVNLWIDGESMMDYGYIVALDETGEVVWYCQTRDRIADIRLLANGHLLYQHASYRYAYEIDLLGRDVRSWVAANLTLPPNPSAIEVAVDTMHHDLLELENGNFLTLATELRQLDEFPTSVRDPNAAWQAAAVVCDEIVEFRPQDGEIVQRLPLADLLDRRLFGYMSLGSFWKDKYDDGLQTPSRDWSHANALVYLEDEDAVLVSVRHLDCLMKIDWRSKQLRWILGDPSMWRDAWQPYLLKPVGDVQWSYHHHSPKVTSRGTIILYDNGNFRARPFAPITSAADNQSRIVEYRVDEAAMTVEQLFETKGVIGDEFYCPFYGEADPLPLTGNLLVTNGGHIETVEGVPVDDVPGERQWARILEITTDRMPSKVFEVVCDSGPGSPYGWSIYRAIRFANLFDGFDISPPPADEDSNVYARPPIQKRQRALNGRMRIVSPTR